MKAVRFHAPGGPEVLVVDDVEVPALQDGEARVRHTAVGVNFIDCYHRSGLYPVALPGIPGVEACGVVEEVRGDPAKLGVKVGDRVAYKTRGPGSYAEQRVLDAKLLEKVPDHVADDVAAACLVKGMTAEYLACRLFDARAGHTALVTAAAGGVGQILTRVLVHKKGARVIAVVGSAEKADAVVSCGVSRDDVIVSRGVDVQLASQVRARVRDGVDVVYDSVGADTFPLLLDAVKRRGWFVSYGNASGPVPPFAPSLLAQKGSLVFTRPALHDWVHDVDEQHLAALRVWSWLKDGTLQPRIQEKLPLAEAAKAHRLLEERRTTGSLVLVP